jgi:hypothetical protein
MPPEEINENTFETFPKYHNLNEEEDYIAQGLSYFSYAAEQIKENAKKAAELAKTKAEEHRLNE